MNRRRRNNEGSIYQRKSDKRWVVAFSIEGKQRTWYPKPNTEEAALSLKRKIEQELEQTPVVTLKAHNLIAYIREWHDSLKAKVRRNTWESYESTIRINILPNIADNATVEGFTPHEAQKLIDKTLEKSKIIAHKVNSLMKQCYKKAIRSRIASNNPFADTDTPHIPKARVDILTPEEQGKVLQAIKESWSKLEDIIIVYWALGGRISEITGLKWQYVFTDYIQVENTLVTTSGGMTDSIPKNESSRRKVYLPQEIMDIIHRQPKTSEYVFVNSQNKPHHHTVIRKQWHRYCERAGIEKKKLHSLRHLQATELIQQGWAIADVQSRGGWSQPGILTQIYSAHTSQQRQKDMAKSIGLLSKLTTQEKTKAETPTGISESAE